MRMIDADALIDNMVDYVADGYADSRIDFESYTKMVQTAPTIDAVEVVHGEWVDAEIPLESGDTMPIQVCNLCKTFYPLAYTGGGHRFCPNCGARMKGADDE